MGDSGKVMLLPRGEYYSATPYEELDCVYYQGRSYVCKQASTGHAPTDTTYWQPMTPDASAEIQALTNDVAGIEGLLANAIGKEITAATAWSDLENMGTYVMNGVPFTGNWSIVLVLKRNENTGVQIAFRVGNASDVSSSYVAYRMYYTGNWSSWAAVNATNMT